MSASLGGPLTSRILSSWFIVEVPGSSGLPMNISAMMQPSAHMSTAYLLERCPPSAAKIVERFESTSPTYE